MASNPPPSWLARNAKWVIPSGCVAIFAFVVVLVAAIVWLAMTAMKRSDAYLEAVSRARASAAVREALGEPLEEGFFVGGRVRTLTSGSATADLAIRLSGPKGRGVLNVHATKADGRWHYWLLSLSVTGTHERVNLLKPH